MIFLMLFNVLELDIKFNWTDFSLRFKGPVNIIDNKDYYHELKKGIIDFMSNIYFDDQSTVSERIENNERFWQLFKNSLQFPRVVSTENSSKDGEIWNIYELSFTRNLISVLIEGYSKGVSTGNIGNEHYTPQNITSGIPFTGIIIIVKGYKLNKAFFPKILDEEGRIIYSLGICDRNSLSRNGYIRFSNNENESIKEYVGINPLRIIASGIRGINSTDIVIPNEIAKRIQTSSILQHLLNECKIVVISD